MLPLANKSTGPKSKLDSRQKLSLKRIVRVDRRITAVKATASLNDLLEELDSAIKKSLIKPANAFKRNRRCKVWRIAQWKKVIYSNE